MEQSVETALRIKAQELGFQHIGFAEAGASQTIEFYQSWIDRGFGAGMDYLARTVEARSNLEKLLPGARSIVAVALNYSQPNPYVEGMPRIATYALGRDYHKVLKGKLKSFGAILSDAGHEWRICVDAIPLLEREWAQRAGIGWFGKNTCLINSRTGSWFLLGFVVTTAVLAPDSPAVGGCGTCRKCIDACPTGAIVFEDGRWQVDSRSCISYWTIEHRGEIPPHMHAGIGNWTFGCDICQSVCPFNQVRESQPDRAVETSEPDFLAGRSWPSLVEILELDHETWDRLTQGSPVRRAGFEGLKRNARINLRNLREG